jgi:NitT/TauT family transport system substrate-binding protein
MFERMKRSVRRIRDRGIPLFMLAALALLQTGAARAADLIPVQIGMPGDSLGYGSYYIAQDLGFFEKNGLKANFVFLTADAIPAALSTGGIQASPLIGSAIRANIAGYKVKAVSLSLSRSTYAIVSRDSIKTMNELKGKKIVTGPSKSTPTFLLRFLLEQHGLDPDKDLQIIHVGSQAARRTLIHSGQADALIDSMKGVLELMRKLPGMHTLYPQSKMPDHSINGVATSMDMIEKNPDTIKRIIRAVAQADEFARKNPGEVEKVFVKYMKAPPSEGKELADAFVLSLADSMIPTAKMLEQDARFLSMAADKPITVEQLKAAWDTRLAAEVEREWGNK